MDTTPETPEARAAFLAEVSHEIRNPLNAIIGFAELLEDDTFGTLNPEQLTAVDDIRCAATHLLHVVNDLLDISRAKVDRLHLQPELLSLAQVVERAANMARGLAGDKQVRLEPDVPLDLAVQADECRLLQVLHNLLANAIRCSPPDGVVRVTAETSDQLVWTVVRDHGCGIDPADHERIFEPFVTIRHEAAEPGVGLGLSVCRNLVEAMGGTIEVDSKPGEGATFRFSLPRAERPA